MEVPCHLHFWAPALTLNEPSHLFCLPLFQGFEWIAFGAATPLLRGVRCAASLPRATSAAASNHPMERTAKAFASGLADRGALHF